MVKWMSAVFTLAGFALLGVDEAKAQIYTSAYAAPAPVVVAPVLAAPALAVPATASPIVGTIPVRRGLFGLRVEYIPVLAPGAFPAAVAAPVVVSPYQAARPIIAPTPYWAAPYGANRPALPAANPLVPNAVIQSGYRGVAPIQYLPAAPAPVTSFYPGAVMTMQ